MFHPCLAPVLFTGPSLHAVNFYRKNFLPMHSDSVNGLKVRDGRGFAREVQAIYRGGGLYAICTTEG